MNGIIVTGHGMFASGIYSSVKLIAGEQKHFECVDFLKEDSTDDLERKLKESLTNLSDCEGILFFCDLVGGSPYNKSVAISSGNSNLAVIGGTNLAMLIEVAMLKDVMPLNELKKIAIKKGKDAVQLFQIQDNSNRKIEEGDGI